MSIECGNCRFGFDIDFSDCSEETICHREKIINKFSGVYSEVAIITFRANRDGDCKYYIYSLISSFIYDPIRFIKKIFSKG